MQDFSVESKTSEISSSSTSWQDLEARYKSTNEVNMTPRSLGTKPKKIKNFEDPVRKLLNLAGQGAPSNPSRNWWQGPTCRSGKSLDDSGTNTEQKSPRAGPKWAQAVRPSPFRAPGPPLTKPPFRLFIAPRPGATHQLIHHRLLRSREERDTILERRGSC
jgi:hypothetical protein